MSKHWLRMKLRLYSWLADTDWNTVMPTLYVLFVVFIAAPITLQGLGIIVWKISTWKIVVVYGLLFILMSALAIDANRKPKR